jgi:hypothetical protein
MARMGRLDGNNSTIDANSPSPIDVSLPRVWTPGLKDAFEAWSKYGVLPMSKLYIINDHLT